MSEARSSEALNYRDESFLGGLRGNSPLFEVAFGSVAMAGVYFGEIEVGFPPAKHFDEITSANGDISNAKHKIVTLKEAKELLRPTDDVTAINDALLAQKSQLISYTQHRETLGNQAVTGAEVLALPAITGIAAGIWLGKKLRKPAR